MIHKTNLENDLKDLFVYVYNNLPLLSKRVSKIIFLTLFQNKNVARVEENGLAHVTFLLLGCMYFTHHYIFLTYIYNVCNQFLISITIQRHSHFLQL